MLFFIVRREYRKKGYEDLNTSHVILYRVERQIIVHACFI